MICEDVRSALLFGEVCEETPSGARIKTHCLYPSFDAVEVYIAKVGDRYVVTDGGGAVAFAYLNGRHDIGQSLSKAAARFGVEQEAGVIQVTVETHDWLKSGILGVANASAYAARMSADKAITESENQLEALIKETVGLILPAGSYVSGGKYVGVSGKTRTYDLVARKGSQTIIVNGVVPHQASVAAKFVSFSDLPANDAGIQRLAVYDRALEPHDAALINRVAEMVSITALSGVVERAAANG